MVSPSLAVVLRAPSKYESSSSATAPVTPPFGAPTPAWLLRTWAVTHSTLSMWRTAQNVRITYTKAAAAVGSGSGSGSGREDANNQDRVEYEDKQADNSSTNTKTKINTSSTKRRKVRSVEGANTADATTPAAFDWRGRGWLFFVTSHWEILGWGEADFEDEAGHQRKERWVVTWFAPTLFTREGIDFYSDRREGLHPATVAAIRAAAAAAADWPEPLAALFRDLQPVAINLPWQEA